MASKYYPDYAGQVPLLLKLNSKTEIPPDGEAFSPCNAQRRGRGPARRGRGRLHALRRLAAPGRGLHPAQQGPPGLRPLSAMPLVIWAYPRGRDIETKGGRDSFYAIDYAARVAMEMGADVVKLNMPKLNPEKDKDAPAPYNEWDVSLGGGDPPLRRVRRPRAGRAVGRLQGRRRQAARSRRG